MSEATSRTIRVAQGRGRSERTIKIKIERDANPSYEPGIDPAAAATLWYVDVLDNGRRVPPLGGYVERADAAAVLSATTVTELVAFCDRH